MKIVECRERRIYDVGFIDPYYIHQVTIHKYPDRMEKSILQFLLKQNTCAEILFPYNFK